MGHLANGDLGMEGSGKRFLENGVGIGLDGPPLKFKKRRVSAIRDFPPGCGRNAAPIDGNMEVNGGVESNSIRQGGPLAEKLKEEVNDVGVESTSVRETESLTEVKTSDMDESSQVPESAKCETTTSPLEAVDTVQTETLNQNETSSPVNDAVESTEKKFPPRKKTSAVRDSVQFGKSVPAEKPEEVLNESLVKKFPPRRKVSAIRDFPHGCGRGVAHVVFKEVGESVEQQGVKADAKQLEKRVQPGAALDSKLKEKKDVVAGVQAKPIPAVEKQVGQQVYSREKVKQVKTEKASMKPLTKIDKGSGNSGVKLGTESVKVSKDASSNKISAGKSTNEPDDDRELVQCLMAKPNCPWAQGKKPSKPAPVLQSPEERGKKILKSPSGLQSEVPQRKKASKSASDNLSNTVENASLESSDDREIVQALMAAPNCPWRHGKKPLKSPGGQAKKFVAG